MSNLSSELNYLQKPLGIRKSFFCTKTSQNPEGVPFGDVANAKVSTT